MLILPVTTDKMKKYYIVLMSSNNYTNKTFLVKALKYSMILSNKFFNHIFYIIWRPPSLSELTLY